MLATVHSLGNDVDIGALIDQTWYGCLGFLLSAVMVALAFVVKPTCGRVFALSVVAGIASLFLLSTFMFMTALGLLAGSLLVLSSDDPTRRTQRRVVLLASLGGLLIACVMRGHSTLERLRARERFQYVSLRERVTPSNPTIYKIDSSPVEEDSDNLDRFWANRRASSIAWLHKSAVAHFLETPDFGVMRMGYPSLYQLEDEDGEPIELPEPSYPADEAYPGRPQFAMTKYSAEHDWLAESHQDYQGWFVDPIRFGDIEDLDHVAGFESHGMYRRKSWNRISDMQEPFDWDSQQFGGENVPPSLRVELEKLQLVGLLYHESPVVYELDTLPELLSAETAETRPLDEFEKRGLTRLLSGEVIHVEHDGRQMRMLGSLRNAKSCVECHEGPENQLLGAFSYTLRLKEGVPSGALPLDSSKSVTMTYGDSFRIRLP